MTERLKSEKGLHSYLRTVFCVFMAVVLATSMTPLVPQAYAADDDKPKSVKLTLGSGNWKEIDVMKEVATLDANMGKGTEIKFTVEDSYSNLDSSQRLRKLVFEAPNGKQTELCNLNGNTIGFDSGKLVTDQMLKLITSTKDSSGNYVKRYERQLNVRVSDTKEAEKKPTGSGSTAGISEDGGSWSFSNGLEYKFGKTGFSFLDNTSMNLGAIRLPLTYKHNPDGTTIVGINCSPDDKAFYEAVKNGNVWQKYTTDKMAEMTKQMDKGWKGEKIGTWGGKSFDWNICGYMEFNTKDPNAPRAVNLIISAGMKAEGHAQYLIFTGTITFTMGGKAILSGKLTPGKGLEGKFGLGAYAGLELFIGVGLKYVAAVGAYGKGQIDIDFDILPKTDLSSIVLSGQCGAKAKLFGFTVYTWKILEGKKVLYPTDGNIKKMSALNADGTATSMATVDADTPYPEDSRAYLDNAGGLMAAQSSELTAQASTSSTILKGIYGETELSCVTTNDGPVIAYIADAAQVGVDGRDAVNRSALVYTRFKNGKWTDPVIVDKTPKTGKYADYSPSISTDGENCYISWLAADSEIASGATIGDVGKKLDVNVATITKDDQITVETVREESSTTSSMPANPKAVKTNNGLYVGWYTNQTSGSSGEVIGVSGTHDFRLYKKDGTTWTPASEVTPSQTGAVTSFDVGSYGGTAACVWSLDEQFASEQEEVTLNGVRTLASSTVYALTPGDDTARMVAMNATNAQFAKDEGKDVLTYAIRIDANDGVSNPYLSVNSSSALGASGKVVLDGAKVYLPTPYYEITGDLGQGRAGNISFLKAGDGTCDIQALVTTGAGNTDWTSVLEATADTNAVTDYCATYANGQPLFIYATEHASAADGLSAQASDDGSVDLNQTTDESLKHLSVNDVDYDEYVVDTGQKMPVTVHFDNDGMLDVSGADLWMLEDGVATKVASSDEAVALDGDGTISFDYTIPPKEEFTTAREFTLYAAPKGATVDAAKIQRELQDQSAMTVSLGAASLSLEVDHLLFEDQESISATVKNDGIVPHAATLVFLDADTGKTLETMAVPELGENVEYTAVYSAPEGYFQKSGVSNIIVTLENDGTENAGYEINNTEFVNAWEIIDDNETPATEATTKATPQATSKAPSTGDQIALMLILALIALAVIASPFVIRAARKARDR